MKGKHVYINRYLINNFSIMHNTVLLIKMSYKQATCLDIYDHQDLFDFRVCSRIFYTTDQNLLHCILYIKYCFKHSCIKNFSNKTSFNHPYIV